MKKTFFYLFALLALVGFTSCDDDNSERTQEFTATINNRCVDGSEVMFSQGSAKIELNYTASTIKITSDYKDLDGMSHTITTPEMEMSATTSGVYSFGWGYVEGLHGYIDLSTGMMFYAYNPEGGPNMIYCTTHLLYAYTKTNIISEDGKNYLHDQSAYMFALDSKGETCTMQISNFIPNTGGNIQEAKVEYLEVPVVPTTEGYRIQADEVESITSNIYTITNLDLTISAHGMAIAGSFKVGNHTYHVVGQAFGSNNE